MQRYRCSTSLQLILVQLILLHLLLQRSSFIGAHFQNAAHQYPCTCIIFNTHHLLQLSLRSILEAQYSITALFTLRSNSITALF